MSRRGLGRWFLVAGMAVVLAGLYTILGFLVAPRIIRGRILSAGPTLGGATIGVGKVSVNPFTLSLTLRDYRLADRRGEPVAAFDTLYLNFQSSSLFRRALTFAELRLVAPSLVALVRENGTVNLQDLMPASDSAKQPAMEEERLPVVIHELTVRQGKVGFEDRQRRTPFATTIDPIDLALRNFTTRPDETGTYQFEAQTAKGEQLRWRGTFSTVPLRSSGTLTLAGIQARTIWEYLRDQMWYEITDGRAQFEANYALDLSAAPRVFTIEGGKGRIDSLRIRDTRDSAEAVAFEQLQLGGVQAQVFERSYRIGEVTAQRGKLAGVRLRDSTFTLSTLFLPRIDPAAPTDTVAPWTGTIDRLELTEASMHVKDQTTDPVAEFDVAPLTLTLEHYPMGLPGTAAIDLQFGINGTGSARVTGKYQPEPLEADLTLAIEGLPLPPFEPYVRRTARLGIPSGTLTMSGEVSWAMPEEVSSVRYTGDLALVGFRAVDLVRREDFTRWARLDFKKVRYDTDPPSVAIEEIVARGAYLRAIIGPDRITNLQHIRTGPGDSLAAISYLADDSTISAVPRAAAGAPAAAAADSVSSFLSDSGAKRAVTPTRIGQIRVVDGTLNFSDLSLTPQFTVSIEQLNGTIKGLSSEQLARAEVDLSGKVDKYAPASITGQINPLSETAFTDIAMKFTGIELTTFTPYSGKFAGYKIDKGKLNLDLHYRLTGRYLVAENRIVFDQLTLGEKVQSPDATSLPVKLALALLKDKNGVIDLDIPLKGDLDDPKFSVMPIVLKALVNLLVKAVTSPFKLLGSLFGGGGGDELQYVAFVGGTDSLPAEEAAKLDSLAVALADRTELKLDIRGAASLAVDREELATRAVMLQVRGDSSRAAPGAPQRTRILGLYRERFQEDPALLVPATDSAGKKLPAATRDSLLATAALERLVSAFEVPPDALRELAQRRAAAVQQRLLTASGIDPSRVFLLDADTQASANEGTVRVTLTLDAR